MFFKYDEQVNNPTSIGRFVQLHLQLIVFVYIYACLSQQCEVLLHCFLFHVSAKPLTEFFFIDLLATCMSSLSKCMLVSFPHFWRVFLLLIPLQKEIYLVLENMLFLPIMFQLLKCLQINMFYITNIPSHI